MFFVWIGKTIKMKYVYFYRMDQGMKSHNLILVTGLLRSGTTWTGKTLAYARGIKYLNEPFNLDRHRKNCPVKYSFQYVDSQEPAAFQGEIREYIDRISGSPIFCIADQYRQSKKYKTYRNFFKVLSEPKNIYGRPLMKDPMAILSSEWIYTTFQAKVIVVLRNPFAFVASLKTAGWSIPFADILAQERLVNELPSEYLPLIRQYASHPPDLVDQGILIWNIGFSRIRYFSDRYRETWRFVRHEDLSKDPVNEFEKLFSYLNLEFSTKVKERIRKETDGSSVSRLSRDSVQNLDTWRSRLTVEEIERIKAGTLSLFSHFYDPKDFGMI